MKATPTPENIKQCTTQLDENLYAEIKSMASSIKLKTYILINKMLLIGAEKVLKERSDLFNNKKHTFNSEYIKPLRKLLKEKGL